jgi:hypothetical protein
MTTLRSNALRTTIAAIATFAASSTVQAQTATFDFANLSATVPTNYLGNACTSGDRCSTRGGSLNFQQNGVSVNAFGYFNGVLANGMVVQDREGSFNAMKKIGAGLGVYHQFGSNNVPNNSSDDNITSNESLKLSFANSVFFSTLGMRSEGHNVTGWSANSMFEYRVDGGAWTAGALPANSGDFALNATGKDFEFRYKAQGGDQFYISGATATMVPEPSTYLLMASGLAGLMVMARRRRSA